MYTRRNVHVLFLVLLLLRDGGLGHGKATEHTDLSELLNRFKQSFLWHNSVSMNIVVEMSGERDGQVIPETSERSFTFRRDHERVEWLGTWMIRAADGTVDPDARGVIKTINTGDMVATLTSGLDRPPIGAYLDRNETANRNHMRQKLGDCKTGGPLWGRNMGNGSYNVAELLARATAVHRQESPENINGISCHVVEAKTEYGEVKAWIAPEKGYAAVKWSMQKRRGDRFDDDLTTVDSVFVEFAADDLQEVDGFWITKVGHLTYRVDVPDEGKVRTNISRVKFNVSNVTVNPDFAALKAFTIDFPEGTRVSVSDAPGIRYIWRNGRLETDHPDG
jgi:hypothetical protein